MILLRLVSLGKIWLPASGVIYGSFFKGQVINNRPRMALLLTRFQPPFSPHTKKQFLLRFYRRSFKGNWEYFWRSHDRLVKQMIFHFQANRWLISMSLLIDFSESSFRSFIHSEVTRYLSYSNVQVLAGSILIMCIKASDAPEVCVQKWVTPTFEFYSLSHSTSAAQSPIPQSSSSLQSLQ